MKKLLTVKLGILKAAREICDLAHSNYQQILVSPIDDHTVAIVATNGMTAAIAVKFITKDKQNLTESIAISGRDIIDVLTADLDADAEIYKEPCGQAILRANLSNGRQLNIRLQQQSLSRHWQNLQILFMCELSEKDCFSVMSASQKHIDATTKIHPIYSAFDAVCRAIKTPKKSRELSFDVGNKTLTAVGLDGNFCALQFSLSHEHKKSDHLWIAKLQTTPEG